MPTVRPKYQVFVSSTFQDLLEERKAVTWEILKAGHIPVGMENFSAYDDRGWKVIDRTLATTDYYVLILAGRYGSIDDAIGMSWTEREYRRAIELKIPVLAFIREKKHIPGDQVDTDEKAKKLAELISDVGGKRLREMWTTPDDLRAKVSLSLMKSITDDEADASARPGWYRGNQLPSPATMDELAKLSSENRSLRDALEAAAKRGEHVVPYISHQHAVGGLPTNDGLLLGCEVENHGDVPFRLVSVEATWWFVDEAGSVAGAPRIAGIEISQRFAKPGEKCGVRLSLWMSPDEQKTVMERLRVDPYRSPVDVKLTASCASPGGHAETVEDVVRWPVRQRSQTS